MGCSKIIAALKVGGNKLVANNNRSRFSIISLECGIEVEAQSVKNIDRNYINEIAQRAMQEITEKNYDSAITKARTLLEEVFCYVIEKKKEQPLNNGNIGELYQQVRKLYNLHSDKEADKSIKKLYSGLNSIVSAIAEMRNNYSDSHGVGKKRVEINDYHARLLVNSAIIMSDFIISVEKNNGELEKKIKKQSYLLLDIYICDVIIRLRQSPKVCPRRWY